MHRVKYKTPLILLLILAAGTAAWFVLRPKPVEAPVLIHPTVRRVAQAEKNLAGLGQDTPSTGQTLRTLRLSEEDLNVYLSGSQSVHKMLAAHGVQAVQIVLLEPASVEIHASVLIRNHPQNIQIDGELASDPKLGIRFTATKAQVGSLPLPSAVVTAETNALAARFSHQLLRHLSLSIQSVTVQKKVLLITGLPQPSVSPQSKSPDHH